MCQETSQVMPLRFLVHDEIEGVLSRKGNVYPFRVRLWQAKDRDPVALVTQHGKGPPPSFMVSKLLNYVHAALLHYPTNRMLFFMADSDESLSQVLYESFGHEQRATLYKPIERRRQWTQLEALIGEVIDP